MLFTAERQFIASLSREMGIPYSAFLAQLWASDVVIYRVAALVDNIGQELAREAHERKQKAEARRPKGRRR